MNPTVDFSKIPLRDIHMPGPVGWWPPALGWWIVLFVLLAGLGIAWHRYRRAYRVRAASKAIRRVMAALDGGEAPSACAQQLSIVLRRFAISVETGRGAVAGLTGRSWLAYLDSRWERDGFSAGAGEALLTAPYAPTGRVDLQRVRDLGNVCMEWVRAQRGRT